MLMVSEREVELSPRKEEYQQLPSLQLQEGAGEAGEPDHPASPDLPIVRFTATSGFCHADDGEVVLDVMRLGNCSLQTQVAFETHEGSAKEGSGFLASSGLLVFEPEEREKTIRVSVLALKHWTPTLEFSCCLLKDERLQNAHLALHAKSMTMTVIDHKCFPSNRFESDVKEGTIANIAMTSLFYEYLKLNFTNPIVRSRTWACLVIDQLHNVFMFAQFFLQVYLVDYVLNENCDDLIFVSSKHHALFLIFLLKVVPFAFLHIADYFKVSRFGVAPASLDTLKCGLLRKMLNADRKHRQNLRSGDLIMAATRDTESVVFQGYVTVLLVVQQLGQLFFTFLYQMVSPFVFDKPFNPFGFVPLVMFPALLGLFLFFRMNTTVSELNDRAMMNNDLVSHVDESATNYALITDYNHRDQCIAEFERLILGHHGKLRSCNIVLSSNHYFTLWTMTIVVASFTLIGGYRVIIGDVTLGMFLTNIHIFTLIGQSWTAIYNHALVIMETFPALERIVGFMNVPSDADHRAQLSRCHREATISLSKTLVTTGDSSFCLDRLPILAQNLHLVNASRADPCPEGSLKINQGELVVLVGPGGGGKGTLLKILGGEILPDPGKISAEATKDRGQFFKPSHLRSLHVSTPMFMGGDLFENLTFGAQRCSTDAEPKRVLTICERLGVSAQVRKHIDKRDKHNWLHVLTESECEKLSIARALIANPEVLCIHHPIQGLDGGTADRVLELLREFVHSRGVDNPQEFQYRRPRTCIITGDSSNRSREFADSVYDISQEHGIQSQKAGGSGGSQRDPVSGDFRRAGSSE